MEINKLRDKYWDEFISFIQNKLRKSLFKDLTKESFTGNHAIQVYDCDNLRLMIGINRGYARCSLHITWDNLNDLYSRLKLIENDLVGEFQLKRQPDFTIKRNPKSVVVFMKDYGYRFPPPDEKEKEILMEWMYENSCVVNEILTSERYLIKEKSDTKVPTIVLPTQSSNKVFTHIENYSTLVTQIYQCKEPCKKPKEQMLLGRLISGDSEKVDLLLIGIGPKESYADRISNRVAFGEYSKTGQKVKTFVTMIKQQYRSLSCWATNAVKCDHKKNQEQEVIGRCSKFLRNEVDLINPKGIVIFGGQLSKSLISQPLDHGGIHKLFGKYNCIQSIHPASRASGKMFDRDNMKILAEKVMMYL